MALFLKVKRIAEEKGLNRTDLSRRANLTFNTVDRIWVDPDVDVDAKVSTLQRIADALGVSLADLIASNDSKTS